MRGRRVVVTGLGIVSPVGSTVDEAWAGIVAGKSGIAGITRFDASDYPCRIAGEVAPYQDHPRFGVKEARRADLFVRYSLAAVWQALGDAGLAAGDGFDPQRAGVSIGTGIGGLPHIEAQHDVLIKSGPKRVSPFFVPGAIINMASGWASMLHDLRGPNLAFATACTTGTHCIGAAARHIAYGDAEMMVAGGSEAAISPLSLAGFASARALSLRNDDPTKASRPFDANRDGFVLGEGSGIMVLEELEHAKGRGASIYCELAGYGMSGDAHHITAPPDDGDGACRAMSAALADAALAPDDIDHVNSHGTSTPLGDVAETRAIRRLFAEHADSLLVSATKSMTGHLLGGAGGIEALFAALAIAKGKVPPTINLEQPGDGCDLNYVAGNEAITCEVKAAISNSFG
ncbi:MAG: beta-ketoacyl-ACP synthase II, partial [Betaproteobacteria bacterium]|nr:beta-ketoacyl-ACP synthase II [Betaproteobacteria bacterium]